MDQYELTKLAYNIIPNFAKHMDALNESEYYHTDVREVLFGFGAEYTITTLAGCIVEGHYAAIKKLERLYETQNAQELEQFKPAFKWYILARDNDGPRPNPLFNEKFNDGEDVYLWMKKITETNIFNDLLY